MSSVIRTQADVKPPTYIDWDARGHPDKRPKNENSAAYDEGCIEKEATEDRYVGFMEFLPAILRGVTTHLKNIN